MIDRQRLAALHREEEQRFIDLHPRSAELVKLHVFAGLPLERAADVLGISPRVAYRDWAFARAGMFRRLGGN